MNNLNELHSKIINDITEERTNKIALFLSGKRVANTEAAKKLDMAIPEFKTMGFDLIKYDSIYKKMNDESDAQLKSIRKQYAGDKDISTVKIIKPEVYIEEASNAAIVPDTVQLLPAAYAGVFSTKDREEKLAGGTGTDIPNYSTIDAWCWARGAGSGCFGTGAGSYQVWAEFGFWYLPSVTRYYTIILRNNLRGFYILRAFDGFWDSKEARATINIKNNVWQYNWKGLTSTNVFNQGSQNINVNSRFDRDINTSYSALLAGGDWVYIRNYVNLNVYARGGSSYSELNYSVGNANYLKCPLCSIY